MLFFRYRDSSGEKIRVSPIFRTYGGGLRNPAFRAWEHFVREKIRVSPISRTHGGRALPVRYDECFLYL
ncbi:Uncharacterized protein dnm_022270 [Desulfonema magnum]|uniref:Uncharacterized protein n=1 Tax=Desulfonema magnum TaxID=45655 RepID=A0A975BIQ4_9BACT|nr:Uncharacterized protein dnm_022270 [Desulfonema magnum]